MNLKFTNKKGFSLFEILIGILIISILISVSIPNFMNILNETRKESTLDILNSSIYTAKNYAINNRTAVFLTVNKTGTTNEWGSLKVYTSKKILVDIEKFDSVTIKTDDGLKFNFNGQITDLTNKPLIKKSFCVDDGKAKSIKYILSINYLGKTKFEEKNACN